MAEEEVVPELDGDNICIGWTFQVMIIHGVAVVARTTWHLGDREAGIWAVRG